MGAKDISPEVAQRAVELVRLLVAYEAVDDIEKGLADEARAIVALLPEVVDPDVQQARSVAADWLRGQGYQAHFLERVTAGLEDTSTAVECALAGFKRGRQLSLDQPS